MRKILERFKKEGKLLIGASGAVNVVNLPGTISFLKKNVCENIKVILSNNANRLVSKDSISYITGNKTFSDYNDDLDFTAPHISLTNWADLFIILPASANIIGKMANGIADDLLSTTILAARCPIILYPNMNIGMWENKALKRNVNRLIKDGYIIKYTQERILEVGSGNYEKAITNSILEIPTDIREVLQTHME